MVNCSYLHLDPSRFIHEDSRWDETLAQLAAGALSAVEPGSVVGALADDPREMVHLVRESLDRRASIALFRSTADLDRAIAGGAISHVIDQTDGTCGRVANLETPATPAVMLTTSGTTGTPKLVRHSWERLTSSIRITNRATTWLLTYHPASFAGLQVVLTAGLNGQVLLSRKSPNVPNLAELALHHKAVAVSGTPSFWRAFLILLADRVEDVPIRYATLGGEVADQGTLDAIRRAFPNVTVRHIYASTEVGVVFSVSDGYAGFPIGWLDESPGAFALRIVTGELQVARRTTSGDNSAWFATGDLVHVEGNRVHFAGRTDSVINVGGAKIQPESVEMVIMQHPSVLDVRVYALPSALIGNLVAADIVLADQALPLTAIVAWARERLPREAVPRRLRSVATLTLNASGKKGRGVDHGL